MFVKKPETIKHKLPMRENVWYKSAMDTESVLFKRLQNHGLQTTYNNLKINLASRLKNTPNCWQIVFGDSHVDLQQFICYLFICYLSICYLFIF